MSQKPRCVHCKRLFRPNPRLKEQRYCPQKACQRARRRQWQKHKMARDSDYQTTKRVSQQQWQKEHRDYWRTYRAGKPAYCQRNRLLQKERDAKRCRRDLAKKDTLKAIEPIKTGTYYLVSPHLSDLAKKDALGQKVVIISTC